MGKSKHKQMSKSDLRKHDEIDQLLQKVKGGEIETNIRVVEVKKQEKKQVPKKSSSFIEYNGIKVNFSDLVIIDHAIDRTIERVNATSRSHAITTIKSILKKATPIGNVTDKGGKDGVLFAAGKVGIILSPCLTTVKTIKKRESVTYEPIKQKLATLHRKEIGKLERAISSKKRKLKTFTLEANLEIAEHELRLHRTRSEAVRNVCRARIIALNNHLQVLQNEIHSIELEKKHVANSMIAVV